MNHVLPPIISKALELVSHGLAIIPTGGEDGKRPLVKRFNTFRHAPTSDTVANWFASHPEANIGVLTGLSGVVVVDVDDATMLDPALKLFGDTPLIIRTPRPGYQLWYRAKGNEKAADLRTRPEGLPIEIKAGPSIVIVPPSLNPKLERRYAFYSGDWHALACLPRFAHPFEPQTSAAKTDWIVIGERNKKLFQFCMRQAAMCSSKDELLVEARIFNAQHCRPPLPDTEVQKTAKQAYWYETNDLNFIAGSNGAVILSHDAVDELKQAATERFPDVLATLACLLRNHGSRKEPFAFSPSAMAKAGTIPGIRSRTRYEAARDILLSCGMLEEVRRGRSYRRYRLSSKVLRREGIDSKQEKARDV